MAGSQFGKIFHISTFGESHGKALGVVVDGCPAGLSLSEEDIQEMLERRRPGKNLKMTQRKEGDKVEILSGIFEGKTTGTSIAMVVWNEDQRSKDYGEIAHAFRPGHADYGFFAKYGFRDYRGGGRSSGRETIARVAAGAIAKKMLLELGVSVRAKVIELAGISLTEDRQKAELLAEQKILSLREQGDSAGGVVECLVEGLPAGIGEPVFDKLDASLAKAVMSIGAVKSVEIGDGIEVSKSLGSENNDAYEVRNGFVVPTTNHAGGILGGISTGAPIWFKCALKPISSIGLPQHSVNLQTMEPEQLVVQGRHDVTAVLRAVPCIESAFALALLDTLYSWPSEQNGNHND